MKIDAREIAALTQAQPAAPRMDMYASIHKALRAFMADTLLGLGRMDVDDDLEFAQTCDRVMQLLDLCRAHLHHENQFVHAAMEARQPGSSQNIAGEHLEHEQAITALADAVKRILGQAIARGGTTLRDFISPDGAPGYFVQELSAYGRGGLPCPNCGRLLKSADIGQRASVWCGHCQR